MMAYMQKYQPDEINRKTCPECGSNKFRYQSGKIICYNCDHLIGVIPRFGTSRKGNKYGARKTAFNGKNFDSKWEATVAMSLENRKTAGDIKDYDCQYRIEAWCYNSRGQKMFKVRHKVDFRVHHNDDTYELLEAKGVETTDYKWRRKFVDVFISEQPEGLYRYTVIKQH